MSSSLLPTLEELCATRRQRQLSQRAMAENGGLQRAELVSPYVDSSVTQFDLDMRRKAEILRYQPTKQSSQTNSMTQKTSFAKKVESMNVTPSTYARILDKRTVSCGDLDNPTTKSAPLPSYFSGVPRVPGRYGGFMPLYHDPAVKLYNYTSTTASTTYNDVAQTT